MKRKIIVLFLTTVTLAVLTPSMLARPAYSEERFYFDESGNEVGYWHQSCYSWFPYQEGEETDTYTLLVGYCPWTFEPFPSCEEVSLYNTNCSDYCVTGSYYTSVVIMKSFSDPFGCL